MTVLDIFDWAKEHGAEHVEIVPFGFSVNDNPQLLQDIRAKSEVTGVAISNYAIGANFLQADEKALDQEFARVEREVEIAHQLGVKRMRHDIAWKPAQEATLAAFEQVFPVLVGGCQRIADFAQSFGIVTSIENHGYLVQASDRVLRIVQAVDRPNFRTTVDTGNFLCADEDPAVSVQHNLPFASMVHLKDFYHRTGSWNPGKGWFQTVGGRYLRGAIFGHGDIDVASIIREVLRVGYDGYVSIEFEGMEEPEVGALLSLQNAQRLIAAGAATNV